MLVNKSSPMEIAVIIKNRLSKILYELSNFDFETFKSSGGNAYIAALEATDEEEVTESEPG